MSSFSTLFTAFFIFLSIAYTVDGIRCFQCNSNNNSGCTNLANYRKQLFYPIPCEDDFGRQAFCRKTVLKIMEKGKVHEPRVIRSCGYFAHKNPCYRADNEGHTETVCQCFEDGCNSANSQLFYFSLIIICLILSAIYQLM